MYWNNEINYIATSTTFLDHTNPNHFLYIDKDAFFYEAGFNEYLPPSIGQIIFTHVTDTNGVKDEKQMDTIPCSLALPNGSEFMLCFNPDKLSPIPL